MANFACFMLSVEVLQVIELTSVRYQRSRFYIRPIAGDAWRGKCSLKKVTIDGARYGCPICLEHG
jgi:hypothetical protein